MKTARAESIVITHSGHKDKPAPIREALRREWLRKILPLVGREFPGYGVNLEYKVIYVCESCDAEFFGTEKIHGCATCLTEVCNLCGYLNPHNGLWYCEDH